MDKSKQIEALVALGLTVSEAVFKALGCTSTEFAERHSVRQNEVTMCLRAYHHRGYPAIRHALAEELGVTRPWLDNLIDSQREAEVA